MTILVDADRVALWQRFMEEISGRWESLVLGKADLRAAVNAIDDWVEANTASFNASIPLPARIALSTKQKEQLFLAVLQSRFDI